MAVSKTSSVCLVFSFSILFQKYKYIQKHLYETLTVELSLH